MNTIEVVWLQDCSGSMNINRAIDKVNQGFRQIVADLLQRNQQETDTNYYFSLACFDDRAYWQHRNKAVPQLHWKDLEANGVTEMGKALHLSLSRLKEIREQAGQAVVILASDGMPTDEYEATLKDLTQLCAGASFPRLALSIGEDADESMMLRFIENSGHLFRAQDPDQIGPAMGKVVQESLGMLGAPPPAPAVTPTSGKPEAVAPTTQASPALSDPFVNDYRHLDGIEFIKKYQKSDNFIKIGLANRGDYIKGKAPVFAAQPTGFVLVALRQPGQSSNILALPNPQMRYQEKLYTSAGLSEFFHAMEAIPSGAFVPEVIAPALITEQNGSWLCSEKGQLRFKKV